MKQELRSAIRSILASHRLALLGGAVMLAASGGAAAELPVVCSPATGCGAGSVTQFVTSGSATATHLGNTLTIDQTSDRALLNWASFNVSADGRVVFNQPRNTSIALNRIFQESPSQILGTVEANGQIYLINPNGFVFGRTARVNAAGILASSLQMSDSTFANGLLAPELINNERPALESAPIFDENGDPVEVKVVVEEGAVLESRGSGGRVMLAAPIIDNAGTLSSPDGQVLLAAGQRVYLQASDDSELRGLVVEVGAGGEAWNRMTGNITAARGNVTIAGLAVNQSGRISASTTVAANGSVRLIARDNPAFVPGDGGNLELQSGQNGGRLELGSTSRIEVLPELADPATAVDSEEQFASSIKLFGREIFMRSGSQIVAPGGELEVTAAANFNELAAPYDPSVKLRVESGAQIDLSGSDVTLAMSRNQVTVELRASELRDSPAQRNGALRGQTVIVDARVGTPLADVSGALAAIPKSIAERTSEGGTAVFNSQGDIVVADGARIDVSGGVLTYEEGPVSTSQLIGADGRIYDIGEADPLRTYVGVINPSWRRVDDRWGIIETGTSSVISRVMPGYVHGMDAGTVQFAAPNMVMNGTLTADTVTGPYQRQPGRQPLGGQLIIGIPDGLTNSISEDYRAPSVTFSSHGSSIVVSDGASLPSQQALLLPTEYLNRGFTRTAIYSNGRITIPESTPLNLAAGSSLQLTGHHVDILADISSIGGTIEATAGLTVGTGELLGRSGVQVGDGVTLDVQGNWVNDALTALTDPFGRPSTSVFADGGSIALAIEALGSELVLGDQVELLASAGAWMRRDATVSGGNGGSIEINAGAQAGAIELGESLTVQAFGVLGAKGGEFSLTAPRIEVGTGTSWSQAQRLDPAEEGYEYLSIGSSLFTEHGFQTVSLIAAGVVDREQDRDALRIGSGTEIQARTSVFQLNGGAADIASAHNLSTVATVAQPDESARGAMDLTFAVEPVDAGNPDRIGLLSVETGASVLADAGSSVAFASVGGIEMDGTVRARGGDIAFNIETPSEADDEGYRSDVNLYLGANSLLDASGTVVYRPIGDGVLRGTLYDGGTVSLHANRGAVVVEQGAVIDISGSSAALDFNLLPGQARPARQIVASNGGVLELVAPEAIAFNGIFRAHAGVGETGPASGGELIMRLSRLRGFAYGGAEDQPTYSTDPRVLRVTGEEIVIGGPTPPNGLALLRTDVIENSGIDALTLEADGRIEFDQTTLSMGRRIVLDSPEIVARNGADVSLSAAYLAVGNTIPDRTAVTPQTGTGSFNFLGAFIEAIGAVTLSGAATTTLSSTGDLRLREVLTGTSRAGHLQTSGDLTLRAAQIYPSTLSAYAISATGDEATLRIESAGTPGSTPLTAGGRLTLNAANIEQAGVLLAPFGSIDFNATDSLSLEAGSVTSVSGAGAVIPFGRIQNGEWIYASFTNVVQGAVPERHIGLNAPAIQQDANATLDLRGGGDLYAYEWVPGTGGSSDALAAGAQAGRYAIMPSLRGQLAPYDPMEMTGSDLQVGDSVYLSGIAGLEPGFYPLLPARYALLPGAMLIESVANTDNIQPGTVASLPDGTPIVAGYRTFGATGLGGTQYTGYAIRPATQARQLAAYDDSFASTFYADLAQRLQLPRPVSPSDGGTLSLLATTSLDMRGIVNVSAAEGGLAGRIEVAATNLEVVATPSSGSGAVQIAASVLNSWRPGELWLGGTVRDGAVDVVAEQVRIAGGVSLNAGEVVLIANDRVDIAAGATVASTSGVNGTDVASDRLAATELRLSNDDAGAAVLAVSDRNRYDINRASGDLDVGSINAATGSVLATGGSLLADAPASVTLDGDFRARGADWQLGSGQVRFDTAAHTDGLNIDTAFLARLQEAGSLSLSSGGSIDFSYAFSLGAANPLDALTLSASSLNNLSGGDVSFAADTVSLVGVAAAAAAPAPVAGAGTLSFAAESIDLDAGNLAVNGFARTALSASGDIRGVGETRLRIGGDLDLTAARVTATSGGKTFIEAAQGAVRIAGSGTASESIAGVLGGALSISANEIEHAGTLFLPSGVVTLDATSRLSVAGTGVIDVSGQAVTAAGRTVTTGGGTVRMASGGTLDTASGSSIDVSGGTGSDAGRLFMYANSTATLAGALLGNSGGASQTGGAFDIYAGSIANAGDLIAKLQTGGFTDQQSIHVRSGDLNLATGQQVTAHTIEWTTDQGNILIDGTMRAISAAERSSIRINGGSGVTIGATGQLNADGLADTRFGGDIEIGSSAGSLAVLAGSVISANGAEVDGDLRLRAAATANDVAITALDGTIQTVGSVTVEPVHIHDVSAAPTALELEAIRLQTEAYVAAAGANIRSRLDANGTLGLQIQPGVELHHVGSLQLDALDLASWRFGASPVALTVRATESITVNGSISDGFDAGGLLDGKSATLRFAAGADLLSADPNAVVRNALADFVLAPGALVRTGTGDIRVTAARDVKFDTGSGIYTGGIAGTPTIGTFTFADRGGNVSIVAGQDVIGAEVNRGVTEWQRRQGDATRPTRWGIDLNRFGWNAGTLGGGDLSITAGRDVTDISATAADSAAELVEGQLTRFGGGALSIEAGGDVNSAMLYVARSEGRVLADGGLGLSRETVTSDGSPGVPIGSLLMLGDAQMRIVARQDVNLETVFNPTALVQPGAPRPQLTHFFTYGDQSSLDARSHGGDVILNAGSVTRLDPYLGDAVTGENATSLKILPSSLTMMSLSGDVDLRDGAITLFPSNSGQLDLFAVRDLIASGFATINMSDIAASDIATPLRASTSSDFRSLTNAASSARHIDDNLPVQITAGRDILNHNISVAKAANMSAGRDIVDITLNAQNLRASDVTSVQAGRDIRYAPTLLTAQMNVGGPGRFDVLTGGNLDLGFSRGLTTSGRLLNPAIESDDGADLNVMVGMGRDVDAIAFVDDVISGVIEGSTELREGSAEMRESLVKFMVARTGNSSLTYAQAASAFKALDAETQRPLLLDLFYGELVASGREANTTTLGFERGYRAIDALFPGSRPADGEQNSFDGDLTLAFSRIYTLAGGDISIAVPGGLVNVGLANPPASIGTRPESELGIVAQRTGSVRIFTDDDVLVNQSRVFTLLGGDIAIWSTLGDIDAGRGSKTSVSVPPPTLLVDANGIVTLDFAGAVAGSGIRTIATDEKVEPGDVDLIAPAGTVNAGDAGIGSSGNLNIAAQQVVGLDNIQVGGVSTGVPAEASGLGASLASVTAAASSSSSASTSSVEENDESDQAQASLAQTALSWLEVFVVGLGEENCKQDDVECLKRQPLN